MTYLFNFFEPVGVLDAVQDVKTGAFDFFKVYGVVIQETQEQVCVAFTEPQYKQIWVDKNRVFKIMPEELPINCN
jgi:hypothetical protein